LPAHLASHPCSSQHSIRPVLRLSFDPVGLDRSTVFSQMHRRNFFGPFPYVPTCGLWVTASTSMSRPVTALDGAFLRPTIHHRSASLLAETSDTQGVIFQQADADASPEVSFPCNVCQSCRAIRNNHVSNIAASTFSFDPGSGLTRSVDQLLSVRFFASASWFFTSLLTRETTGVARRQSCIAASFLSDVPLLPSESHMI